MEIVRSCVVYKSILTIRIGTVLSRWFANIIQ